MDNRSIVFKYWVEFTDDGNIKSFHKNKYECESECEEYVVKLIPIRRNIVKGIEESAKKMSKVISNESKRLDTELKKALKDIKGVLK